MLRILFIGLVVMFLSACNRSLPTDIVIAHRGTTYWAPEETEAAFRWARNIGADYLEFDVQLTKDSVLVAFHDKNLKRTTNVAEVFPGRAEGGINDFTFNELRSLDAGSWFNEANPERARGSYSGQKILRLEDVVMIARGYRIARDGSYEKDTADNGNRPGLYIETKSPKPGTESLLAKELKKLGWETDNASKLMLQSFSRKSIVKLDEYFPGVPKCLLLWSGKMGEDIEAGYIDALVFVAENSVGIIGPSIAGEPNNYSELSAEWMTELVHAKGLHIHSYTFDTPSQFEEYADRVEGVFTNRADLALEYYGRKSRLMPEDCLKELGYLQNNLQLY